MSGVVWGCLVLSGGVSCCLELPGGVRGMSWVFWDAYMVEISQDGYFLQKLSLFFQLQRLIMSTFCIESTVSIASPGQSCLPELGKSSF